MEGSFITCPFSQMINIWSSVHTTTHLDTPLGPPVQLLRQTNKTIVGCDVNSVPGPEVSSNELLLVIIDKPLARMACEYPSKNNFLESLV